MIHWLLKTNLTVTLMANLLYNFHTLSQIVWYMSMRHSPHSKSFILLQTLSTLILYILLYKRNFVQVIMTMLQFQAMLKIS